MNKAKYKGKWYEKGYHGISTPHLIYEYRGREYEVVDYKFNTVETLAAQHRKEQEKIDKAIEEELKPKKKYSYENTAEYAFKQIFDYWEKGEVK